MALLVIFLMLIVSVALFFMLAIKFGSRKQAPTEMLDLESFPKQREKQAQYREDSEDLIV